MDARRVLGSGRARYLLVAVLALLVWLPAVRAGLVWDDYEFVYVTQQRWHWIDVLDAFWPRQLNAAAPYLRPLPRLSFYLDDALWGAHAPWGWHLTNVLLHAANAALVAALAAPLGALGSLAAGVVFALHPLHTETVSWISARPDLLSATFLLLAALLLRRGRLGLSAAAFLAALCSKESAVAFPLVVAGDLWLRRWPLADSRFHWLALLVYGAYRLAALRGLPAADWRPDYAGWLWRPWVALAYPLPLDQADWAPPAHLPAWAWGGGALVCSLALLPALLAWRRCWPLALALLALLLPLLPVFQLGPSFQFGRYLYLPAALWALAAGAGLATLQRRSGAWPAPVVRWSRRHGALPGALLGAQAVTLAALGTLPRAQFQEAGALGTHITRQLVAAVPQPAPGARLVVHGMPRRANGWGVFGGFLDIALAEAYGRPYVWGAPDLPVVDVNWELDVRRALPPPRQGDLVLRWDGADLPVALPATGKLRVYTLPAVPTTISLNGEAQGQYGIDWREVPAGVYRLGFTPVEEQFTPDLLRVSQCLGPCGPPFEQPASQPVIVRALETTEVGARFPIPGFLRVTTGGATAPVIAIDGKTAAEWGLWEQMPAGKYTVSFQPVAGTRRPCSVSVEVVGYTTVHVHGDYRTGTCDVVP